ncbi:hypothetical protein QR98_0084570 [Sarcoptes scabiei]|uniref:Uncharacterized protein n=1 Tax=Sarcoptes scabiei TaxID=52283 RepID=A0A132AFZ5_SARSC|nr:hypothetical protein QR98_0084570 [Sarcoptes scabiei]
MTATTAIAIGGTGTDSIVNANGQGCDCGNTDSNTAMISVNKQNMRPNKAKNILGISDTIDIDVMQTNSAFNSDKIITSIQSVQQQKISKNNSEQKNLSEDMQRSNRNNFTQNPSKQAKISIISENNLTNEKSSFEHNIDVDGEEEEEEDDDDDDDDDDEEYDDEDEDEKDDARAKSDEEKCKSIKIESLISPLKRSINYSMNQSIENNSKATLDRKSQLSYLNQKSIDCESGRKLFDDGKNSQNPINHQKHYELEANSLRSQKNINRIRKREKNSCKSGRRKGVGGGGKNHHNHSDNYDEDEDDGEEDEEAIEDEEEDDSINLNNPRRNDETSNSNSNNNPNNSNGYENGTGFGSTICTDDGRYLTANLNDENSSSCLPLSSPISSSLKKKSRFNLGRKQKSSRKKREKVSARRERKATKTLAIVLGNNHE